jgi:hypothetical protein
VSDRTTETPNMIMSRDVEEYSLTLTTRCLGGLLLQQDDDDDDTRMNTALVSFGTIPSFMPGPEHHRCD